MKLKFHFYILILLALIFNLSDGFAQVVVDEDEKEEKSSSVGLLPVKMANARSMFLDRNVRGALIEYREILAALPDHPQATYRIGECHYALKNYQLAEDYLTRALELDSLVNNEIHYWMGMTKHRLAKLDEAVAHFKKFRSSTTRSNLYYFEVDTYIEQCQFAEMMMAKPRDVEIENLGLQINSRFDDYAPSVTADGRMLVFTSRRPDIKGGGVDTRGDHKYFENVYFAEWNPNTREWSAAKQVPGELNTTMYDGVLSIAPDGKSMYVYKNNASSAGDIHYSVFVDSTRKWTKAEKLGRPINTSWFESSVSITADGSKLYFISERPGGEGQGDIYVSERRGDKWGKPKNLGPTVNTPGDEKFVFVHPNGKFLFFASNGHQTMGSYDIFRADITDGEVGRPINLGYPINTVNEESTFSLTEDNQRMFIAAEYEGSLGERDIFIVDLNNFDILKSTGVSQVYLQGAVIDASNDKPLRNIPVRVIDERDGKKVYDSFTDRNGEFEFKLLRGNHYEVQIEKPDTKLCTEPVDLENIDQSRLVVRKTFAVE